MIFHGLWWSWFYLLFFVHVWGDPVFEEIRLWRFFINCTTQMRGLRAPSLQTNATGGGRGWPGSGLSSTREKLVPRDWLTIGDRHQFLEQILDLVGKIMVVFFSIFLCSVDACFFFASLLSSLFLCLFVLVMNQCQRCQKGHDMCPTDMGFKLLPTSPNKAATFDGYQALVPPGGASGDLFGISATWNILICVYIYIHIYVYEIFR